LKYINIRTSLRLCAAMCRAFTPMGVPEGSSETRICPRTLCRLRPAGQHLEPAAEVLDDGQVGRGSAALVCPVHRFTQRDGRNRHAAGMPTPAHGF
jgi:hypothetical protein